ncbi:IS3 family transposase [Capillibacterium thermochitinicola]|uniref:IS3 family transposase n=1 Tax=Capillibacterium thermochitinicola TaxID=2699427 RepID=A0A8J6I462_9FIRM|nr:IS3 family transposase [Capillibacterium thermochitinicola]MBA2134174.1 IS3 family transposase [Capillibacterium thermochitinicola]
MYSYEDRIKAVKLYIKYDLSVADTIRELGYPTRNALIKWYKEYKEKGDLHTDYEREPKFSREQKQKAVDYYLEHGRCIRRTVRVLGYPSRTALMQWIDKLAPGQRKVRITHGDMIQFSEEKKKDAVISLCTRDTSAAVIAEEYGVSRACLYNWKKQLLDKKDENSMVHSKKPNLPDDKDELQAELESLRKQVHKLQLEIDILTKAAEIIKKDLGIDRQNLTNKEKTMVIDALRTRYQLDELLEATGMAKSSYFYQRKAQTQPDKYFMLRSKVRDIFNENRCCYGYRRVHAVLKNEGITCSEKVIRMIMSAEQLIIHGKKKRRYNSYFGEISPAVPNLLARDFHADKPNEKWVTDLTEFQIPAGKVYLSPILDCFDGLVVSWSIGTSPDAELVNSMLDEGVACLSDDEHPILHSDRGGHYRWPGWILRMDTYGLIRSMSKKGCTPDNAACEGFFGTLKTEMFYGRSWEGVSLEQFIKELDCYIRWYNEKRIKMRLGGMSPLVYRRSLGLVA